MEKIIRWMDKKFYPQYSDNWDDELFRKHIMQHVERNKVVLDLGAGAGIIKHMNFKNSAKLVCGIDPDPRVLRNPYLHEAKRASGECIPYPDEYFDVVYSDNVLEHIANPEEVFLEVRRVLKCGGYFLFKTPNKWHYVPLIARLTPHRFHQFVNRWRGRKDMDIFPTLYRANSKAEIKRLAALANLEIDYLILVEGRPEYLRFSAPTYAIGIIYERLVNAFTFLEPFRIILIGALRKP